MIALRSRLLAACAERRAVANSRFCTPSSNSVQPNYLSSGGKLTVIEFGIEAALCHKLSVLAALDNVPVV